MCSVNKRVCEKESKPTPLKYFTPGCLIEKAGFLSEDVCRVSCPLPTLPHCPQCWTLIRLPSDSLIVTLLLFPSFFPPCSSIHAISPPISQWPPCIFHFAFPKNLNTHTLTQFLNTPWTYFSLFSCTIIWKFIYPPVHSFIKSPVICMVMGWNCMIISNC